jgi:hypothetical protein
MSSQLKHSKKKNVALLYEFLVRSLARAMVERDETAGRRASALVSRFFREGSPLREELSVFEAVLSARGLSESGARRVISEARQAARELDRAGIDAEKGRLVGEMNRRLGRDVFTRHRIDEYKLLASLHVLLDPSGPLHERVSRTAELEEGLVRNMTSRRESPQLSTGADRLVCSIAAKKFQERYGTSLSPRQRKLLDRFVRSDVTGDKRPLVELLERERADMRRTLSGALVDRAVSGDPVMRDRMVEAAGKLRELDVSSPTPETVQEAMLFQRLCEEIESGEE